MSLLMPLIVALPLVCAALVHLLGGGQRRRRVTRISVGGAALTWLLSLLLWAPVIANDPVAPATFGPVVLLTDPLSALMALAVSSISLLVRIYSVRYMAQEPGYTRFFVLLDLMSAALLALVAAGDLITLAVSWHLIGVLLYFLLGQDTRSRSAYRYAAWTLITHRIGDLPLALAAALLFHAYGTWSLPQIFERMGAQPAASTVFNLPLPEVVGALIALSAFARSAQWLLHTWLPYSMAGPTPVSALMHAGIVNAGGLLFNRFAPLFAHTSEVLFWVFAVGLATAVIGSVLMLTQHDIKKSLGYSTMGQMGFMIMECGVGAFSLAIYHLIAHGLFKATLFLRSGGVIGDARKQDGVPKGDLYTFVVERRPARAPRPWLIMSAITLLFPLLVLLPAHWWVVGAHFHPQGAVVLLFFGWVTGAQLIYATDRLRWRAPRRAMALALASFAVVAPGYLLVSHAMEALLYPDPALRDGLYAAASMDAGWFTLLMGVVSIVMACGWLLIYRAGQQHGRGLHWRRRLWRRGYALILAQLHVNAGYSALGRWLITIAHRLNVRLRWR